MFGRKRRKERKAREAAERERANAEVRDALHSGQSSDDTAAPLAPPPGHQPIPPPSEPPPPAPETGAQEAGLDQDEATGSEPSGAEPVIALLTDGERLGFEPELHIPEDDADG